RPGRSFKKKCTRLPWGCRGAKKRVDLTPLHPDCDPPILLLDRFRLEQVVRHHRDDKNTEATKSRNRRAHVGDVTISARPLCQPTAAAPASATADAPALLPAVLSGARYLYHAPKNRAGTQAFRRESGTCSDTRSRSGGFGTCRRSSRG